MLEEIIYGPIKSRRLGSSLGINLLPNDGKICSFDCIYCERGWNKDNRTNTHFPIRSEVAFALEKKLQTLFTEHAKVDYLTFSGNGEPTLHPDFSEIISDTILLREKFFPNAKIAVLTNGTQVQKQEVFCALQKIDNAILKFDSAIEKTARLIDKPVGNFSIETQIENYKKFRRSCNLQTLFLTGEIDGKKIDNTNENEITAYLRAVKKIMPKTCMLYTIDRTTPCVTLCKVPRKTLDKIALDVNDLGIETIVAE